MQAQRLSLPTHISAPFNFPHSSHVSSFLSPARYSSNLVFKANSKSACYSSVKRVSKLLTGFRKYGGLVMASGGVAREVDDNDKDDGFYIRKCVELARKAIGRTSPNPMVGCVIVKDGKIVGEGFHPKAGQPHAEVFALRDAGDLAEDATAYVSLEPCNHYGRTPPCTEALIKAKVKKVVVGMTDPNPIVASKGLDRLRDEGINVTVGVEEELCNRLNEAYIHWMLTRKPFVTLRYSLSVNGHFLNQLGEGVTDCGGYYSQLLQEYDAIILSPPRTGEFSAPISKEPGAKQPLWIVTTRSPCFPVQLPPLTEEAASNLIIFTDNAEAVAPATAGKGIETVVLDRININAILEYCKQQGLCSVLLDLRESSVELEGLLNDCFEQNALQKVIVELLPIWKESSDRSSLVELKNIGRRLNHLQPKISDQSIVLEGYF